MTGVKTAPGSVTDNCTLVNCWRHSTLRKNWKASRPLCGTRHLHLAGCPLGRGGSLVCVDPRLLLSALPKLSRLPWRPLDAAYTEALFPARAPPCCFTLLFSSHLNKPFSSHIYQMQSQRDHLINRLPLCGG